MLGVAAAFLLLAAAHARVVDVERAGAVADAADTASMWQNGVVMNQTLASLQPGDTLLVPNKTFHLYGGVYASGLRNVTLRLEGTLSYAPDRARWPLDARTGKVRACMHLEDVEDLVITSTGTGTFQGNGAAWWGALNYLVHGENRPRLLEVFDGARIVVERLAFLNSPYWTTLFHDVSDIVIRYCEVSVHVTDAATHTLRELQAFNTDGFDIAGRNVHIHDCSIWNDDDCVAVKDLGDGGRRARCSENWLVERLNASGVGLTIGSIGASPHTTCVRNITFRDTVMVNSFKGIYLKSRHSAPSTRAVLADILYENITMLQPSQWAIWIGPAQQADSGDACSLLWPTVPGQSCPVPAQFDWRNITLRNIRIVDPKMSPGVVIGNLTNPMRGLVFDNVVVEGANAGTHPWGKHGYACFGVKDAVATGGTRPVPPCFNGGRQCVDDSTCVDAATTPCCSGRSHLTVACGRMKRCGCVPASHCAMRRSDCCSQSCEPGFDFSCALGIGCRCAAGGNRTASGADVSV